MIRALLIEDDNDQIEMYKMAFQLYDMELLWASDGYTGLELAKKSNPHIVICDMLMEVIDGMGTLKLFKADPKTKDIPFVFLSNLIKREVMEKAKKMGVTDFWAKTEVLPKDVVEKVRKILEVKQ